MSNADLCISLHVDHASPFKKLLSRFNPEEAAEAEAVPPGRASSA